MNTVSVPVSELTDLTLDWVVAVLEAKRVQKGPDRTLQYWTTNGELGVYEPSTNWSQGGPILDRELIAIEPPRSYQLGTGGLVIIKEWVANVKGGSGRLIYQRGPTALVAAFRCYVSSRLGQAVEVPAELLEL